MTTQQNNKNSYLDISEISEVHSYFTGTKENILHILGVPIIIYNYKVVNSENTGNKDCSVIQLKRARFDESTESCYELDDYYSIILTKSIPVTETLRKIDKENFPFGCKIIKAHNKNYYKIVSIKDKGL